MSNLLSVVLPARNEASGLAQLLPQLCQLLPDGEIIVVNDGSLDATEQVAKEAGATVISHTKNRGKGAAIKTGFKNSKGDIVAFIDADLQKLALRISNASEITVPMSNLTIIDNKIN